MNRLGLLAAAFALTTLTTPALACDPDAEQQVAGEIFDSRAPLQGAAAENLARNLQARAKEIDSLLSSGDEPAACEKIEDLKDWLKSFPER
jgi:hypothetical protein